MMLHNIQQLFADKYPRNNDEKYNTNITWNKTSSIKKYIKCQMMKKKVWVQLFWSGYPPPSIHRCEPTTARHGDFCLLRFRPGPVRPSLDNLDTPSSPKVTILMPSLVRTPDRHRTVTGSTPDLKPSTTPSLQVAGLQEYATTPSW